MFFRHTKPGGYLELWEHQLDEYVDIAPEKTDPNSAMLRWFSLFGQGLRAIGIRGLSGAELKSEMEAAGYVDVTVKQFKQPFGYVVFYPTVTFVDIVIDSLTDCTKQSLAQRSNHEANRPGHDGEPKDRIRGEQSANNE